MLSEKSRKANEENLKKAQARAAEMKAAGIHILKAAPKNAIEQAKATPTLPKCLRAYFWQHEGVIENQGCEGAEVFRQDAEAGYLDARERSRGIGLRAVINEICWRCECGDDDPGAGARIRDCKAPHCALHPVRTKKVIWRPITLEQP